MSVEKINSEELKKMLGRSPMSDDELENISGGDDTFDACSQEAYNKMMACSMECVSSGTLQEHQQQCMQEYNLAITNCTKPR